MRNEDKATFPQLLCTFVLFCFGSSVVLGVSGGVAQDAWISIILGAVLAVPMLCIYARLFRLFPEKDLFEIMHIVFGKLVGKVLTVLIVWYATHLGATILRNFSEFTQISPLTDTPQIVIRSIMILTVIYLVRCGTRVLGKWSLAMIFLVLFVVVFSFAAVIPKIRPDDLMPFFEHPKARIAASTFELFSFPFGETVVFLCLANSLSKKDSPYKLFLYGLLVSVGIFIIIFLRNLSLLGPIISEKVYFPSFVAVRIIVISDFLARIEGSISSNFLFAGIVKITVCLIAASKGAASLFGLKHYRPLVMPMGMLMLALCSILYKSMMEMFRFLEYYPYYAFPFQVILPLVVWIGGEIYVKKHKQTDLGETSAD